MMNKRILSFLLAVMLIVGLMPTSVFATENEGEPAPNPVIEPAGDGEDADGITPLTEEDEDIVPQNGEGEEGEDAEPCTVCNEPGCEKTHTQCEACGTWDCEKTHTQCEVCDAWDCTEHKPCDLCGAYDCGGEHVYCTECDKYNCGIDHNAACDKCGVPGCTKAHIWCDTCQKEDCGVDHSVTTPSEPEGTEGETEPEEKTFAETLLEIENLSDLVNEICKEENENAYLTLTTEEIIAIQNHTKELYAALKEPTEEETAAKEDILFLLSLLDNAPEEKIELPDLIPGDYDSIIAHLDALYEEAQTLSSYRECEDLHDRLFTVTLAAVESDELLITSEQMVVVNKKYDKTMEYLEKHFGYTDSAPVALYSGKRTSFTAKSSDASGSIEYSKGVTKVADNEYLLTLDAFVTGEAATITKTKPADIVMVLDQSASMYAPMGASGGKSNSQVWDADDFGGNVTQYTKAQWKNLFSNDSSLYQKATQLGYFVAQSIGGGNRYCEKYGVSGHEHTDEDCKTYDWFVIQYLPNGDAEGNHWYFYRIKQTANPSRDSQTYSKGEIVHTAAPVKYKSFDSMPRFNFYKSQYGALYDAISSFGKGIVEANAGHRLAVVAFSAGAEYKMYADGSGIYVNGNYKQYNTNKYYTGYASDWNTKRESLNTLAKFYAADTLTANDYKSALMNADNNMSNIMASINAVKSDSWGTNHDVGMDMANKIFAQNPINHEERDRIILMFTDGAPSPVSVPAYANDYGTTNTSANNQAGMRDSFVKLSYTAKTTHKAQIYTIWTSTLGSASSMFMRYASSDYPNAQNYTNHGSEIASPKYASGVKTGEQLLEAFGKVFEDVSNATNTVLKTETVIRDIIAPSFTLPTPDIAGWDQMTEEQQYAKLAELVEVYESKYQGKDNFAGPGDDGYTEFADANVIITKDANGLYQVDVKNYDFSANYVTDLDSGGYRGAKLVIKVPIVVKPDFLGGDNVVTNGTASGIYASDGSLVGAFEVPKVNIDVSTVTPLYTSKDIYLSQAASLPEIIKLGEYHQNEKDWKVDSINNAYVNIVYTVTDPTGASMTYTIPAGTAYSSLTDQGWSQDAVTHPLLKADTTYTVTCKVVSTNNENNKSEGTANPEVKVYKPEIHFKDSAINLGQTANYEDQTNTNVPCNFVNVVWKHGETVANVETMGAAPTLEYGYTPAAAAFTDDTNVKVTVTAKSNYGNVPLDQDITEFVTFYRDACDYEDCEHDQTAQVSATDANRINFVVHIKSFDLKITKDVDGTIEDPNQSFLFHVTGPDGFDMKVMVVGENSVTIKGLPAGVYTVTELTDWSWRYICTDDAQKEASAANAVEGVTTVTFTNKLDENKWLSGDSFAENQWSGSGITANKSN